MVKVNSSMVFFFLPPKRVSLKAPKKINITFKCYVHLRHSLTMKSSHGKCEMKNVCG